MQKLADRLKSARESRNLSQAALAQEIGVSRGVIFNIERGLTTNPQTIVVNAICETLDIRKDWLLSGAGEMSMRNDRKAILEKLESLTANMSDSQLDFMFDMIESIQKHFPVQEVCDSSDPE